MQGERQIVSRMHRKKAKAKQRQANGIQQQVNRQQSGKTGRQACRQVDGWRVAGRMHVSRHSG